MDSQIDQETQGSFESISISNQFNELEKVQRWLDDIRERFTLSERDIFKLDLVLCEALPNIIDYGYEDEQNHTIFIRLINNKQSIELEIIDDGIAFNPFSTEHYTQATSLEVAAIDGRGIHLIKSFTDSQNYQRVDDLNIVRVNMLKTLMDNPS